MPEPVFGTLNKTGVYQIRNTVNNKLYIGSTTQGFFQRWRDHMTLLDTNKHHSIKLQRAWDKYGGLNFAFEILEACPAKDCIEREQYYLDTLLSASTNDKRFTSLGYNTCRTAGSRIGTKQSKATKEKIRQSAIGRRHTSKTRQGMSDQRQGMNSKLSATKVAIIRELLKTQELTQEQIATIFGVSRKAISDIKLYKTWRSNG